MLKTSGLSKTFKNAAEPALSDINLEIAEGEFICIVDRQAVASQHCLI